MGERGQDLRRHTGGSREPCGLYRARSGTRDEECTGECRNDDRDVGGNPSQCVTALLVQLVTHRALERERDDRRKRGNSGTDDYRSVP